MACEHLNHKVEAAIIRLTSPHGNTVGYTSEIKITCADCKMPFEFIGFGYGSSPNKATVNIDRTELRAPIKPLSNENLMGETTH